MKEVSNEKISGLRDIILDRADGEKKNNMIQGKREADAWVGSETEKLQREMNLIIQDAFKRAEDIHRRQILSAERERSTETLRLQNRMLQDAMGRLQDKLARLREQDDYLDILAGMCADAVESIGVKSRMELRLSAVDAPLAGKLMEKLAEAYSGLDITFNSKPAPILGGCWVSADDGRRHVNLDWQSLTQEMADSLAERLLPLL